MAIKSVQFLNRDMWFKELLLALTKPNRTHQEQPPEKVGHTLPPPGSPRGSVHKMDLKQGPGP